MLGNEFIETIKQISKENLVFIDESGILVMKIFILKMIKTLLTPD
ncbi:IS630 family transposase [Orientia tsutsugamushi]|nr:IS630 family transposase [Orientia tsutsugamushi]